MKRQCIALLSVLCFAAPLVAESSGSLALAGVVEPIVGVAFSADTATQVIDLSRSSDALVLGNVVFTSNRTAWRVKVYSANGSRMRASGTSDDVPYSFTLGSLSRLQEATLGSGAGAAIVQDMQGRTGLGGVSYPVSIRYQGDPNRTAGTYTDLIYIEISAN